MIIWFNTICQMELQKTPSGGVKKLQYLGLNYIVKGTHQQKKIPHTGDKASLDQCG